MKKSKADIKTEAKKVTDSALSGTKTILHKALMPEAERAITAAESAQRKSEQPTRAARAAAKRAARTARRLGTDREPRERAVLPENTTPPPKKRESKYVRRMRQTKS